MAKIKKPIEFTTVFDVTTEQMEEHGAFCPALNVDTRLFIDPVLLERSGQDTIRDRGVAEFHDYFEAVIKLVRASKQRGDKAWREAHKRLIVKEPSYTSLGYGSSTTHGSAIGTELAERLLATAAEIIDLGVEDPDLFKLLPLLEEGMGPDRISDMATQAIFPALAEYTEGVAKALGLPTEPFGEEPSQFHLPVNTAETRRVPVILVPSDVLRRLPIASDWAGVADAAAYNESLRQRINDMIGDIWEKEVQENREQLRKASLASREAFETLVSVAREGEVSPYSIQSDPRGLVIWRDVLQWVANDHPLEIVQGTPSPEAAIAIVSKIVEQTRHLIEKQGLWKLLWDGDVPRHESSAQLLFFAIAHAYCEANNLDVTPEAETGSGPVDFKFSAGFKIRILIELKLSTNKKLVHGYEKQLKAYAEAEEPIHCIFLVIDVGKMGKKLEQVYALRNDASGDGKPFAVIEEIDGQRKPAASKR